MSRKKGTDKPVRGPELPMGELVIGGATYQTKITGKFSNRVRWERPDNRRVESVIPGTIQKIMVREGQQVEHGEPLLILEAMKMRNEVRSPVAGVVDKIHVSVGEQVPKSHLLVQIGS